MTYLCDPVLGDDPKGLYIDERAANAIANHLIPVADITTPNRFELSFLLGKDIRSADDAFANPVRGPATVATSIPSANPAETLNALITNETKAITRVPLRSNAPHGTGDLFSALRGRTMSLCRHSASTETAARIPKSYFYRPRVCAPRSWRI